MRHRRRQSGGMFQLNKVRRDLHFWRCQQVTCQYHEYQKDIQELLKDIYEATQHELDEVKKINAIYAATLQAKFNIIKRTEKPLSQQSLNVKSLQCVVIMTEICRVKEPGKPFSEYPIPRINDEYNQIISIPYENYDILLSIIPHLETIRLVLDPKYILVLLGEMSLLELVSTYANRQYLIGITTEMAYADGNYYSPFEFVHHDIIHGSNREFGFGDYNSEKVLSHLKSFTDYLETLPSEEEVYKISLALFLITHEIVRTEYILGRSKLSEDFSFRTLQKQFFIDDVKSWKNEKFFGGLLSEELRSKGEEEIFNYLDECFKLLKQTWNNYFQTPEGLASLQANSQVAMNTRRRENRNRKIKAAAVPAPVAGAGGPIQEALPAASAPYESNEESSADKQVDPKNLEVGEKYGMKSIFDEKNVIIKRIDKHPDMIYVIVKEGGVYGIDTRKPLSEHSTKFFTVKEGGSRRTHTKRRRPQKRRRKTRCLRSLKSKSN